LEDDINTAVTASLHCLSEDEYITAIDHSSHICKGCGQCWWLHWEER